MKCAACLAFALAVTMLCGSVSPADAQVLYGSIIVDVRDQSGGAVPGAEVTITKTETGWTRSATSSEVGAATFTTVPPGTYEVRVNISGFKEFRTTGVRVSEDNVLRVNSRPRSRTGHRHRHGQRRRRRAADRSRRCAHRNPDRAARESAGAGRAQLSEPLRHRAGHLAAREHALGGGEPGARPRLQLERHDAQRERDPHRRRDLEQPVAAARRRVRAGARSDRIGRRDDEHVRRRSGTLGRHVGERADQERHERAARLGVRVLLQRVDEVAAVLPAGGPGEAAGAAEPVRRHARRSDRPQQAVLLRKLPGHVRQAARAAIRHGADRGDAQRRFLGVAHADLRPEHRQRVDRRGPHGVCRQHHSARPVRSDRAEADRRSAAAESARARRQLLRDRRLHLRSPQRRREDELQRRPTSSASRRASAGSATTSGTRRCSARSAACRSTTRRRRPAPASATPTRSPAARRTCCRRIS